MIFFTVIISLICLFVVFGLCLPAFFAWEDKMVVSLVLTVGVACGGFFCGGLWLTFCAAINWTIQNILT